MAILEWGQMPGKCSVAQLEVGSVLYQSQLAGLESILDLSGWAYWDIGPMPLPKTETLDSSHDSEETTEHLK